MPVVRPVIAGFGETRWSAAAGATTLTILVTGVKTGATVTLVSPSLERFPNCCRDGKPVLGTGKITVKPNFYNESGWWGVAVINPDLTADTKVFYVDK